MRATNLPTSGRSGGRAQCSPASSSPHRQHTLRVAAVLAPADRAPREPAAASDTTKNGARSLSALLHSAFNAWSQGSHAQAKDADRLDRLEAAVCDRAQTEADALDAQREQAGATADAPSAAAADELPDISPFLRPAGVMEARYVRVLSSLSALTYHLDKLTPSALLRRHRLKLVTTSKVCELHLREPRVDPADALDFGDGMATSPVAVEAAQATLAEARGRAGGARLRVKPLATADAAAPATVTALVTTTSSETALAAAAAPSAVDRVATSLAAAAAAASSAAQGVYSAAAPYASALANNIMPFTSSMTASLPVQSVAAQLQSAAAAGHSSAVATVATVSAALESTWGRDRLPKECQSPTEWYVADDTERHVRYFVIQGSDNLDHWRVNLTFDPVTFEDPVLGVKVHRGVYEAAQVLYDRFLPLVLDHLATSPFARVAFTGHSLGGSLGTVLMLMYVRRGVLPRSAISPVYTFGAPAVFCEGGAGGCACGAPAGAPKQGAAAAGVLQALGLPTGAVRNVLMSRDIVPRAFTCDYTLVADLLKRVSESFRDHGCLNSPRTVMFDFIGNAMVLQPDAGAAFVARGEKLHPMLPPTAGLYVLREPTPFTTAAATLQRDAGYMRDAVQQAQQALSNLPAAAAAAVGGGSGAALVPASAAKRPDAPTTPAPAKGGKAARVRGPVTSSREALFELMNTPHPLDILADPGAYGTDGAISRYHNPDNYTRALGSVLRQRHAWRRLVANAGAAGIRVFAPALDPSQLRQAGAGADSAPAPAAQPSHAPSRRAAPGGKQSLLTRLSPRSGGSSGQLA